MRLMAATVIGLSCVLLGACETTTTVTFVNETANETIIWEGRAEVTRLGPGEHETYVFGKHRGLLTLRATDAGGDILYEQSLTWDELKDLDRVVVKDEGP